MAKTRTIILVGYLAFCGTTVGAEAGLRLADQLVGRWESTSFVTTNCILATNYNYPMMETNLPDGDLQPLWMSASLVGTNTSRQTNLILCVYDVGEEWTDPRTKKRCADLFTELGFTDHAGRERSIPEASGNAILSGNRIEFHVLYGYLFSSRLTNGVWVLETVGRSGYNGASYKVYVEAVLRKVSSEPGEPEHIFRAEHYGPADGFLPVVH